MKKLSLLPLLSLLVLVAALSSFNVNRASVREEQTRKVDAFRRIGLAYPAYVVLKQGGSQSVRLEGDAEQLSDIITEVEDGRLVIKRKSDGKWFKWNDSDNNNKRVTIYITAPKLDGLSVSGSGQIKSEDTFKAATMELAVSGSGSIKLQADAEEVVSRISGSGTIEVKGASERMQTSISGSGSLKGYELKTDEAKVSISGSGSCEIYAKKLLKANISGSGRVYYDGQPNVDSRVSGSGSVKRRG